MIYFILILTLLLSFGYFPVVVGGDETCIHEGCNEPIWEESDEYCIFHDPDPNKDKVLFEQKLKEKIERGDTDSYDFSGFVFPYVIFKDITFEKYVDFNNAHFHGGIDFSGAIFKKGASFNDATFHSLADFKGTQFLTSAPKFDNAIFEKETHFNNTYFEKGAHFVQTIFEDYVFFTREPNSQEATFGGDADFRKAKFVGEGKVEFRHVIFGGKADFNNTIFGKETIFTCGEFYYTANFSNAVFEGDVDFVGMTFGTENGNSEIHFNETEFHGETWFYDPFFNVNATFEGAKFKDDLYFKRANFNNTNINFSSAKFEQMFIFESKSSEEYSVNYLALNHIKVLGYAEIITTNLEKATFEEAYLENMNFIKCKWPVPFIIHEEADRKRQKLSYEDLETVYRNLKNSFTKYGQSDLAGKTFYREMEMKRLNAIEEGNSVEEWKLYVFKYLCGYGEKPENVIFCSIGIITIFAILFWILGIEARAEIGNYRSYSWKINNRRRIKNLFKTPIQSLTFFLSKVKTVHISSIKSFILNLGKTDFIFCFLFSITSFSTLGAKYIKPRGNASRWFSAIESLIGMLFIALFIYVFVRKMLR
ncbi:MAG: pentapeptide repeat-containing protein [Methanomicrobia archaeon]|nr:pentapeptide repeat-containing protein [Methanomicrobia archaeon]MCK4637157.1 pentapeptide repeat-containing protein [Methanomicrobia archaeon]